MDRKEYLKARIMEGMGKKSGTKPMSDKEKSLAALAHPKDKITHKDVLVGRGVLKKEEVEQVDEGNKENKAKKNTYVANIIKKKLSSQVLPSLKFGRRELKKEEVEQVDIVESLEKPKTIKVTTKNGWNFDGLIKVTGSDYHIVKHPVTGKQYRVDKSGNSIEENVEAATEYMTSDIQEERVRILEKINMKKAKMGDVIKDFYKSKAPQFKGRSKEKRRQMAVAAKLSAMRKRGSME